MPVEDEPAVDETIWSEISNLFCDEGDGAVNDLIDAFLEESIKILKTIQSAFVTGDFLRVSREAHALRSPSASIGAIYLASLCHKVEIANSNSRVDLQSQSVDIDRLEAEIYRVFEDLRQRRREPSQ